MKLTYYPEREITFTNIYEKHSADEVIFLFTIIDYIIDSGNLIDHEAQRKLIFAGDIGQTIKKLVEKKSIVLDQNGNIIFVYPVSAFKTSHKVILEDGREFNAMCAIDALGAAFFFKKNTKIVSECKFCRETINIEITNQSIFTMKPTTAHILRADLSKNDNWAGT